MDSKRGCDKRKSLQMAQLNLQYLVDDKGRRQAVLLSIEEYSQLIEELEDLQDVLELEKAVESDTEFRNYKELREELTQENR